MQGMVGVRSEVWQGVAGAGGGGGRRRKGVVQGIVGGQKRGMAVHGRVQEVKDSYRAGQEVKGRSGQGWGLGAGSYGAVWCCGRFSM